MNTYPCPCCGYLVFDEPPGSYNICPICFWEDDISQLRFVTMSGGANRVSLVEGQRNFISIGASEERLRAFVRSLSAADRRDARWRPVEAASGDIEVSVPGKEYGQTYPQDPQALYYWRDTYWRRMPLE